MRIEVLCSINSGEFDRDQIVDLPKEQALALIRTGAAKKIKEKPVPPDNERTIRRRTK